MLWGLLKNIMNHEEVWKLQELRERDLGKRGKDLQRKLKEGNASRMCSTDYQQAGRHMTRYGIRLDVNGATQGVSIAFC